MWKLLLRRTDLKVTYVVNGETDSPVNGLSYWNILELS